MGTPSGKLKNQAYSADIQLNNMKHALLSHLKTPDPFFGEVVHRHIYLRRSAILAQCEQWCEEEVLAPTSHTRPHLMQAVSRLCVSFRRRLGRRRLLRRLHLLWHLRCLRLLLCLPCIVRVVIDSTRSSSLFARGWHWLATCFSFRDAEAAPFQTYW